MPTFNGTESLGLRSVRSGNTKTVAARGWCFRTAFASTLDANRQPGVSQPCLLNHLGMTERVVQPGLPSCIPPHRAPLASARERPLSPVRRNRLYLVAADVSRGQSAPRRPSA
jgi:hypothetical protein